MGSPDLLVQLTPPGVPSPHPRRVGKLPAGSILPGLGWGAAAARGACCRRLGCSRTPDWLMLWRGLALAGGLPRSRAEGTLYEETQEKVRGLPSCDKPRECRPAVRLC